MVLRLHRLSADRALDRLDPACRDALGCEQPRNIRFAADLSECARCNCVGAGAVSAWLWFGSFAVASAALLLFAVIPVLRRMPPETCRRECKQPRASGSA